MSRRGFLHGVAAAVALAVGASVFVAVSAPLIGFGATLQLLIPILAFTYLLYFFGRSEQRTGRLTTIVLWMGLAGVAWFASLPLSLYLLLHAAAIWLVRSLYRYSGFIPAVLDLGLSLASVAMAVWAALHSGSVWLAVWSFFLTQALHVAIPRSISESRQTHPATQTHDNFERAKQQADRALRHLLAHQSNANLN